MKKAIFAKKTSASKVALLFIAIIMTITIGLHMIEFAVSPGLKGISIQKVNDEAVLNLNTLNSTGSATSNYDAYTDSDYLFGGNEGYSIHQYKETLFKTTSSTSHNNTDGFELQAANDDPIVNIIPKEIFMNEGEYLHIGKEYGFFAKTFKNFNYENQNSTVTSLVNNTSYVMVFDVENDFDLENQAGVVNVIIEPLFQFEYIYLKNTSEDYFCISNQETRVEENYTTQVQYSNTPEDLVVPSMHSDGSSSLDYSEVDKYYVSDVSMQMSLLNENNLNYGMTGYDAQDDLGSFFTSMDYEYDGKKRVAGEFPSNQLHEFGTDMVKMGIGQAASCIPGVGTLWSLITNSLEVADHAFKIADGFDKYYNGVISDISTGKISTKDYFPDKLNQIINYDKLVKAVALVINTDENESVWFGKDNYVRGKFKISQSSSDSMEVEYTRLSRNIGIKILDKDKPLGEENVMTSESNYNFNIRDKNYKEIGDQKTGTLNILPNGINMFMFKPQYSGNYELDFSGLVGTGCDVYISGVKHSLIEGVAMSFVKASEGLKIEIYSYGNMILTNFTNDVVVADDSILFNMKDTQHIVKVCEQSFVNMSTTESRVKIETIFNYNNGYIVDDKNEVMIPASTFDANFTSGGYRYVLLTSASYRGEVSLEAKDLETVSLNNERNILGNANGRILKFNCMSLDSSYLMTFDKNGLGVEIYNENGVKYFYDSRVGKNQALSVNLDGNQSVYIKVTFAGSSNSNTDMLIKQSENSIIWYTSEDGSNYEKVSMGSINIKRGEVLYIRALFNDKVPITDPSKFMIANGDDYVGLTFRLSDSNKLELELARDGEFNDIVSEHESVSIITYEGSFSSLEIFPKIEDKVEFEVINKDSGVQVSWYNSQYIYRYNLNINNGYGKNINVSLASPNFGSEVSQFISLDYMINSQLSESTNIGAFTFEINKITYGKSSASVGSDHNVTSNSEILNVLFASGVGSSSNPFKVSTANEFDTLGLLETAHPAVRYYKQTANIDYNCKAPKSIGLIFEGHYDGGNKSISNISITRQSITDINNSTNANKTTIGGLFGEILGSLTNSVINNISLVVARGGGNSADYIGGVVGVNRGLIENVTIAGKFDTHYDKYAGGITGINYGEVRNSVNEMPVRGYDIVGGIVGMNYGVIYKCSSTSDIDSNGNGFIYIGTICGKDFGEIEY